MRERISKQVVVESKAVQRGRIEKRPFAEGSRKVHAGHSKVIAIVDAHLPHCGFHLMGMGGFKIFHPNLGCINAEVAGGKHACADLCVGSIKQRQVNRKAAVRALPFANRRRNHLNPTTIFSDAAHAVLIDKVLVIPLFIFHCALLLTAFLFTPTLKENPTL